MKNKQYCSLPMRRSRFRTGCMLLHRLRCCWDLRVPVCTCSSPFPCCLVWSSCLKDTVRTLGAAVLGCWMWPPALLPKRFRYHIWSIVLRLGNRIPVCSCKQKESLNPEKIFRLDRKLCTAEIVPANKCFQDTPGKFRCPSPCLFQRYIHRKFVRPRSIHTRLRRGTG